MTYFRCKEAEQDTIDSTQWIVTNRLNNKRDYFNFFKANVSVILRPVPWSSRGSTLEAYLELCQTLTF